MAGESNNRVRYRSSARKQLREEKAALEEAKKAKQGGFRNWWNEHVEPKKPRWTYYVAPVATAIQAIVAFIAVFAVFVPAYLNYRTTEENNRKVREAAVIAKAEADIRFRQDEQQKQFSEVQTRIASADEKTRAVAMLQLAELATRKYPQLTPPTSTNSASEYTDDNYPYFLRAASQFAIALTLEEKPSVRNAIKEGIEVMSAFVKIKDKGDDGLLAAMVNKLAVANRTAKTNFIHSMAEWSTAINTSAKEKLAFLAGVTRFCNEDKDTQLALQILIDEGQEKNDEGIVRNPSLYIQERRAYGALRTQEMKANKNRRAEMDAKLLPALREAIGHLIDSRDALATAVRAFAASEEGIDTIENTLVEKVEEMIIDARSTTSKTKREAILKELEAVVRENKVVLSRLRYNRDIKEHRTPHVSLSECFLAGADLSSANLVGVKISSANLTGAKLTFANLMGADLTWAKSMGADLSYSNLMGADLTGANLMGADLSYSNLMGATLPNSNLTGANLASANLIRSNLFDANLTRACVFHSTLYMAKYISPSWKEADYEDLGMVDTHLKNNVKAAYIEREKVLLLMLEEIKMIVKENEIDREKNKYRNRRDKQ